MIPSTVVKASERDKASELRSGILKEAKGDTNQAFFLLSLKTVDLLDTTNDCEANLELAERTIVRQEKYLGYENKGWIERTWDSDGMKVVTFIGGIWLGTRIVHIVN